ncbi:hypothetical protein [Methylobacterium radiodurans]|uniref:Uncharacterized protein n=1 Tax=Methylobacterium radiodurans TaxID=2202828 RepID=A0A2U8VTS2_9HYPH|nr:hypothetical protein [Methylobacterium radiodurans]AWN37219.1 hypothetical protein DK427_17040 [Methylobacterium radiodurans]
MRAVSAMRDFAIATLREVGAARPADAAGTVRSPDLVAIASAAGQRDGGLPVDKQARAKITEAMFSVNTVNLTKVKTKLFERLGELLNVRQESFDTAEAYGRALKQKLAEIRREPGSEAFLAKIEKELGLDKLKITLDELTDAIVDPDGEAGRKLDAAIEKQYGKAITSARDADTPRTLVMSSIGTYRPR